MKATVSVLIVSYNTRQLTIECLESLASAAGVETIVVDNASTDGSVEAIRALGNRVQLIACTENLGFAKGVNLAATIATGDYVLLLNPDARLCPGALDTLVKLAIAVPDAGLYGGMALDAQGAASASCFNRPTLWSCMCQALGLTGSLGGSLFAPESIDLTRGEATRRVDIISGCFLLVRADVWRSLGGLDPSFFMYGEDFDFSLRAANAGWKPIVTTEARVIHHGSASKQTDEQRLTRLLRGKAQFYRRHFSERNAALAIASLWAWAFTRMVSFSILRVFGSNYRGKAQTWRRVWQARQSFLTRNQLAMSRAPVEAPH